MRILKLTAENIKRLKTVEITPDGDIIQITGANGSGKSSVLDAIMWAFNGKASISAVPVRTGEERAKIVVDCGEITVTRKFTADGTTSLAVEADGAQFKNPQTMLDKLLGALTFDPLAFSRMAKKDQLAELKRVVKVDVDLDELARFNDADFASRTGVNRTITQLKARLAALPAASDEPVRIDVDGLLEELTNVSAQNADVARLAGIRAGYMLDFDRFGAEARQNRDEAERLLALAESQEKLALAAMTAANEMVIPEPLDASTIRDKVLAGRQQNTDWENWREQRGARESLTLELEQATRDADALTAAMATRTEQRTAAIAGAAFPVDGLGFGDDGVMFNGVPFEQASGAEQLRVSMALAMAANPTLRVLRIKDGSLLDAHSLELVAQMARDKDYQVWIECVDTSGLIGVVMEDGSVKGAAVVEAPE